METCSDVSTSSLLHSIQSKTAHILLSSLLLVCISMKGTKGNTVLLENAAPSDSFCVILCHNTSESRNNCRRNAPRAFTTFSKAPRRNRNMEKKESCQNQCNACLRMLRQQEMNLNFAPLGASRVACVRTVRSDSPVRTFLSSFLHHCRVKSVDCCAFARSKSMITFSKNPSSTLRN